MQGVGIWGRGCLRRARPLRILEESADASKIKPALNYPSVLCCRVPIKSAF